MDAGQKENEAMYEIKMQIKMLHLESMNSGNYQELK